MEAVGAAVEVEMVEAGGIAVLDPGKSGGEEFALQFLRAEEEAERLAGSSDAGGEEVKDGAATARERIGAEGVVEANACAGGEVGNGGEGGAEGFKGEVGDNAKPTKEGGEGGVEASLEQTGDEGLVLEVEGDKGEVGGDGNGGLIEHEALPLLGGGEIDLKNSERGERVAVSEGVEACAEDDILHYAASDCVGQLIFSEAAARSHEAAEVLRNGVAGAVEIASVAVGDEGQRDGVVEDAGLFHELVRGSANGDSEGGSAGLAVFHNLMLIGSETVRMNRMTWIGWALLSALFAAATALLAKVGVAHVDSNLATALRTSVVVVFAWGIALTWARPAGGGGLWAEVRALDARTVTFLALSGLATGLSWICYFRALQMGPASRVAPLDKLSVPLVMVFAWLLLGEKMTPAVVAGGLLITAGAVVMALA